MKLLSIFILIMAAVLDAPLQAQVLPTNSVNGHVSIWWSFPTNAFSQDLVFKIYETPTLDGSVPMQVLTNVAATNFLPFQGTNFQIINNDQYWPNPPTVTTGFMATNCLAAFSIQPGQHFFYVTASNFWGESALSDPAATPPVAPFVGGSLRIEKIP